MLRLIKRHFTIVIILFSSEQARLGVFLLPFRAWELLLGGAIVFIEKNTNNYVKSAGQRCLLGLLGFSLLLISFVIIKDDVHHPSFITLLPAPSGRIVGTTNF